MGCSSCRAGTGQTSPQSALCWKFWSNKWVSIFVKHGSEFPKSKRTWGCILDISLCRRHICFAQSCKANWTWSRQTCVSVGDHLESIKKEAEKVNLTWLCRDGRRRRQPRSGQELRTWTNKLGYQPFEKRITHHHQRIKNIFSLMIFCVRTQRPLWT